MYDGIGALERVAQVVTRDIGREEARELSGRGRAASDADELVPSVRRERPHERSSHVAGRSRDHDPHRAEVPADPRTKPVCPREPLGIVPRRRVVATPTEDCVTRFYYSCAHEQFPPGDLLRQAAAAEAAGFDGIGCSDHVQPWWEPGESAQAWIWLGAVGQVTTRIPIGSAVTPPVYRYHPALVAQAFATLEVMYPGRAFLGVGSGESLNESPLGMDWPEAREQLERLEEALELIDRLFDGERVDHDGRYFRTKAAYLHTRPERRPPIYVSAFHPGAARLAGRLGDGLWSLADPKNVPDLLDAYRAGADDAGREPGEILLQTGFSWAASDDAALEAARVWKGAGPPEYYVEDWHDPRAMYEHAEETIDDDAFRELQILSADPEVHVERIRAVESLGATIVVLMNISGADPLAAIDVYAQSVLPALRGRGA